VTAASEAAARLRAERAALVDDLEAGRVPITAVATDSRAAPVKVVVIAQAVPGLGKVRSRRILDGLDIDHGTRWGELSSSQADRLVEALATADGA
jgi:hypothetical protein